MITAENLGFLELLLELKEEYGFALSTEAIDALAKFTGAGKAAKIAKSLAAMAVQWTDPGVLKNAAYQSQRSRIARVERLQQSQYYSPSLVTKK